MEDSTTVSSLPAPTKPSSEQDIKLATILVDPQEESQEKEPTKVEPLKQCVKKSMSWLFILLVGIEFAVLSTSLVDGILGVVFKNAVIRQMVKTSLFLSIFYLIYSMT